MTHKLLLLTKDNEQYVELLNNCYLPNLILLDDEPRNIKEADIWLADPTLAAPIIGHGENLKWLQSTYSNVNSLVKPRLRKDYQLTNIRGIFGPIMSEFIFSSLLAHTNRQTNSSHKTFKKLWLPNSFESLKSKTILLLGTGSTSENIALTAKSFGMTVLAINKDGRAIENIDKVSTLEHLDEFIEISDAIVNILPSTAETRTILNKKSLMKFKPNAIFFNLGLEDAIDFRALDTQLKNNTQQQVFLDVFNQEPLSDTHFLRKRPNITITPYIPAPSFAEQVMEIFSNNFKKYITGKPLNNQVCFSEK